jgi:hypothetical protein
MGGSRIQLGQLELELELRHETISASSLPYTTPSSTRPSSSKALMTTTLDPQDQGGCDATTVTHHQDVPPAPMLTNVVSVEDVPPNGGYGWVCTACCLLMNANTWGVNAAWAIFLAHYLAHDTFEGGSPFAYGLIGGLSISQALM